MCDAHYLIVSFSNYLISRSPDRSGKPGAMKPWFLGFGAATNGSRCQDHKNRLKGEDLQRRAGIAAQIYGNWMWIGKPIERSGFYTNPDVLR